MNNLTNLAAIGKPLLQIRMYRPMLVTLIHEFIDLHRTAHFLVGVCMRHSTATCTAAQYVKQLKDVETLFEDGFNVQLKKMKVPALVNMSMQLGMTYDYILYVNVLITRLHTVCASLQSYMMYYLVLQANKKDVMLGKVKALDAKCVPELSVEWKKIANLNEHDYEIQFSSGLKGLKKLIHAEHAKTKSRSKSHSHISLMH